MQIIVPENVDGGLTLLPNGTAVAALEKVILGKSQNNQPKATFIYVIIEEMETAQEGIPTVGEKVLETYSLQPQALFNIASTYKQATKETLPQGDYDEDQFIIMMNDALGGTVWNLELEQQPPYNDPQGELRTVIVKKVFNSR